MPKKPLHVIDVDHQATTRTGLRGQLDRMYEELRGDALAVGRTIQIIDQRDKIAALVAMPQKLIAATQHTQQRRLSNGNGHSNGHRKPKKQPTMAIHGKRLTLFLLEKMDDSEYRPLDHFKNELTQAGSPPPDNRSIAGIIFGALYRFGYVKKNDNGVRRLAAGTKYAADLRVKLETKNLIGENYSAPQH